MQIYPTTKGFFTIIFELAQDAASLLKQIPYEFFCSFIKPFGDHHTYWYRRGTGEVKEICGVSSEIKAWVEVNQIPRFRIQHPDEVLTQASSLEELNIS